MSNLMKKLTIGNASYEVCDASAREDLENVREVLESKPNHADINTAVKKAAPRNLLDNSDFRNPVNQRGATTKSGPIWTHVIDRWYISLEDGETSELTPEGLSVNADFSIQQRLPKGYLNPDAEYTSAVYFSDGSFVLAGEPSFGNAEFDSLSITIRNIGSKKISAVGLYKGKYTEETLPEYQPKGYGAELAECLRYYRQTWLRSNLLDWANSVIVRSANSNWVPSIIFETPMRITPTITIYDPLTGTSGRIADFWSDTVIDAEPQIIARENGFIMSCSGKFDMNHSYYFHYSASADL